MTMKRRVIYMDDATWESIRAHAAKRAETISEHIRRAVSGDGPLADSVAVARAGERAWASAKADAIEMTAEEFAALPAFLRHREEP